MVYPEARTPLQRMCEQCGAPVSAAATCDHRFSVLLALDHSRAEPWGSRHALAFAVFTLQHSRDASPEMVARCWEILHRVYVLGEDRTNVADSIRQRAASTALHTDTTPATRLEPQQPAPSTFAFTIDDMADFAADTYVANLDVWCRATLAAWVQ